MQLKEDQVLIFQANDDQMCWYSLVQWDLKHVSEGNLNSVEQTSMTFFTHINN